MRRLIDSLEDRFSETVVEMWIGELIFGLVCELAGVWFVKDKIGCSIGLWLGIILSIFCTWHMYYSIDRSLSFTNEKDAGKYLGSRYLIRYFAIIALIVVLYFTGIGDVFTAFLGYLGMKPAAYIQPFIHKLLRR